MTIDEIFDAMPAEAPATGRAYLIIDPQTRTITVPESEAVFGVEGDENAARKYFMCPRYVGDGLDLASMFLTMNYRNANGDEDGYLVDDVQIIDDYVTFSWKLWPNVVAYMGAVQFAVCADLPNSSHRRGPDWNTTLAQGEVLEGLDPDRGDVEGETSDVVTQLRAEITDATAIVEAAGAGQVQTVQAAGTAATAAAQAQIEAKGAATLATIPADYTTMAGKVNEHANAIKGKLSGEIVQAGDVSPVEHYLGVKVHGKNLFNTKSFFTFTETGSPYISEVGDNYIILTSPTNYAGNGVSYPNIRLCDLCPQAIAGKIYTFSFETDSAVNDYMYLSGAKYSIVSGKTYTFTKEMLESNIHPHGFSAQHGEAVGACTISNIQLEEGTEATEYTPYIDPAGVTVARCGKNLIDYKKPVLSYSIESTEINNGLHLAGRYMASFPVSIPAGTAVTMSWNTANAEGSVVDDWRVQYADNTYSQHCKNGAVMVPQLPVVQACLYVNKGDADGAADFTNIQLELGDKVTEYEPYKGATAMPDESGVAAGLPSAAPTMTLLADTPGVTIECEYNRDSNAVYAELLAKIAAMSGTT